MTVNIQAPDNATLVGKFPSPSPSPEPDSFHDPDEFLRIFLEDEKSIRAFHDLLDLAKQGLLDARNARFLVETGERTLEKPGQNAASSARIMAGYFSITYIP